MSEDRNDIRAEAFKEAAEFVGCWSPMEADGTRIPMSEELQSELQLISISLRRISDALKNLTCSWDKF